MSSALTSSGSDEVVTSLKTLGYRLLEKGLLPEAAAAFRRALSTAPQDGVVYYEIGRLLISGPAHEGAAAMFRRALAIDGGLAAAANGLAFWFFQRRRYREAAAALGDAIAAQPANAEFRINRAAAFKQSRMPDEAVIQARTAIVLAPGAVEAQTIMAEIAWDIGDSVAGIAAYRRARWMGAATEMVHGNLLLAMQYDPRTSAETLFEEHRRFGERFGSGPRVDIRFPNAPDPERRLTVGYVSSDFRNHSIARVVLPWLAKRNVARFRVVAFSDVAQPDAMTEQMRGLCDDWHTISGLSDSDVAAVIRRSSVDILVVLAGHFDNNRRFLALHRPAPLVVSAHDTTTSGIAGTQYLLADRMVAPRGGRERFVERVVRLPVFPLQSPLVGAPVIGPLPALAKRYVTFGSFNNPFKITPATVALWARTLKAVPGSRLVLKYANALSYRRSRDRLTSLFAEAGIDAARLTLAYTDKDDEPIVAHLDRYNQIDIALDPIPFNGSTTTFEALWMGVPVVTRCGETMMARWTAAILAHAGHPEWIADDETGYVDIVTGLASDLGRLAALRQGLRAEVAASRICNAERGVANLERVYRAIWRRWCRAQACDR